jgi:hypothetical protein
VVCGQIAVLVPSTALTDLRCRQSGVCSSPLITPYLGSTCYRPTCQCRIFDTVGSIAGASGRLTLVRGWPEAVSQGLTASRKRRCLHSSIVLSGGVLGLITLSSLFTHT